MTPKIATARKATASNPATTGCFRIFLFARYIQVAGLAKTGSPFRYLDRSSERESIEEYRLSGFFSRHFNTIVCKSSDKAGWSFRGGVGSSPTTFIKMSVELAPSNGGC